MMLNRTCLLSVIVAIVSTLSLFSTSSSAAEKELTFHIENTVILGQDGRKNSTLSDRFKQMFNKILQDDSTNPNHDHRPAQVVPPAIPTQPPKPPTAAEVQQSINAPSQGRASTTPQSRRETSNGAALTNSRDSSDETDEEADTTIFDRLTKYRQPFFSKELEQAAQHSRQTPRALTPSTSYNPYGTENNSNNTTKNLNNFEEYPAASKNPATLEGEEESVPRNIENRQQMPRVDQAAPNQVADSLTPSQQVAQRIAAIGNEPQQKEAKQLVVSASPQLEMEIEKPPATVVGQEVTYRIRVTNVGNAPAEQVVLTIEIPSWIDIRHTDTGRGKVAVFPREDGSGISDIKWEISRIDLGVTDLLVLRLIPQDRRSIELLIDCDFRRPKIVTKVEVREPKLEMELIGSDEVLWNDEVIYTLFVRNIGNGDAENLRLDLQQTNSEDCFYQFPKPLQPGEEADTKIHVIAGKEQEYIDIAVVATGSHDLKSEVKRRIRVLRPKLEMIVQTQTLHFVDNPAEFTIRVRNIGNADADKVNIKAELPLGAQHIASSEGGIFAVLQQQNIVEWRGMSIAKGETQTFSLTCIPKREGECRVSVDASDSGGVLATSHGTFTAEAIIELDLAVHKQNGPVDLGQETDYTIQITNIGTKAAENVEVSIAFGWELQPTHVTGWDASSDSGQVVFDKIPVILPKDCITLKVTAKAERTGTAQIKTQVTGDGEVRLEKGLSAYIVNRQKGQTTASGQSTQNDFFK